MSNSKIETGIHYKPIHSMSMYKQKKKLPLTEKISNSIVTLPTSPNLKKSQIEFIIQSINKFI
jgi:dTDP-4-amino-4,6-dideoxygalactose transaminase